MHTAQQTCLNTICYYKTFSNAITANSLNARASQVNTKQTDIDPRCLCFLLLLHVNE